MLSSLFPDSPLPNLPTLYSLLITLKKTNNWGVFRAVKFCLGEVKAEEQLVTVLPQGKAQPPLCNFLTVSVLSRSVWCHIFVILNIFYFILGI